jgi:sucrose phosphorylase
VKQGVRAVLDLVAARVALITESNVPFIENISYLGNIDPESGSSDEAQLVYQFSLAPLVLHALISGNSAKLTEWVSSLPSPHNYFNFIASHDGIGLLPAQGILDDADIDMLIERTRMHGGKLSYKTDTNGNQKVYELNITLYDFLNHPQSPCEKLDTARYLTSQVIMLELAGVPGVYTHSLFGSSNCSKRTKQTEKPRMINREKFTVSQLKKDLCGETRSNVIFKKYLKMVSIRKDHTAFNPVASQRVLRLDARVFSLLRKNTNTDESIICISNMTSDAFPLEVDISELQLPESKPSFKDLLSGIEYWASGNSLTIDLEGYHLHGLLQEVVPSTIILF